MAPKHMEEKRVIITLDEVMTSSLEKLVERLGVEEEWLLRELLRPMLQQLWWFISRSDIHSACQGLIDPSTIKSKNPARRMVEAAQVVAAIKRSFGNIPREVDIDRIQFKRITSRRTIENRIRQLVSLGIARLVGNRLVFDAPEIAEKLLDCAMRLELLHGFRLIRQELKQ